MKKVEKIIAFVIIFTISSTFSLFSFTLTTSSSASIIPAGVGSVKSSYGGKIYQTMDCSSPTACTPTAPEFPICLVIRCILQIPFIQQSFDNYLSMAGPDAFDQLREQVLEPQERDNCLSMCAQMGLIGPACVAFCAALVGLQEEDESPAGQAVKAMKEVAEQAGISQPAIAMILQPMNVLPACNASRPMPYDQYILGMGLGQGLYYTQVGDEVGDNCTGRYFPPSGF